MAYMMAMRWASFSAIGLPSELGYSTAAGERMDELIGYPPDGVGRPPADRGVRR